MKRHKCDDVISGAVCSMRIQRKWRDLTFRALIVYDDSLSEYVSLTTYILRILYVYSTRERTSRIIDANLTKS